MSESVEEFTNRHREYWAKPYAERLDIDTASVEGYDGAVCHWCGRAIVDTGEDSQYRWVDPEATGDDSMWRETCDEHDTRQANHEPEDGRAWDESERMGA